MISKMNKIMKKTNRAPAYFLVKSVRLKMLREKKKARGKKGKGKKSVLRLGNMTESNWLVTLD